VSDEELERPGIVPGWMYAVVLALAVFGLFALIGWLVRLAFGLARGLFFVALVIGVIALVRMFTKRR
jgi:hypothetical protein